jgi:HD superfamily phosphodiesterase
MTTMTIEGISIPDSKLAREVTELVRDTESPLLFNHSSRVYYFGALAGNHRGLKFDPELLYTGAMFHDMGLTHQHSSHNERFEVDGANAAIGPGLIEFTRIFRWPSSFAKVRVSPSTAAFVAL